MGRFRSG